MCFLRSIEGLEELLEQNFKALVVLLILNGRVEEALGKLAERYGVVEPKLKVGLPKGRRKKVLGCYSVKDKTIYVLNSEALKEPFTVLHEFYHHLRTAPDARHRGSEKRANEFAREFVQAYGYREMIGRK